MKIKLFPILSILTLLPCLGQQQQFTEQDSLRGSITPERAWWDLGYYHLEVTVDPEKRYIAGKNTVRFTAKEPGQIMQLDLQPPMILSRVIQDGMELPVTSRTNAHFITLARSLDTGDSTEVIAHFEGHPKVAEHAPWDGGFSWEEDGRGHPFVATSCQGLGASVWWPNKDHPYDEVDSMDISLTVPKELVGVSNGRLKKVKENGRTTTYHWQVQNPINNYGVNVNLAPYESFSSTYQGEKGILDLQYYVLPQNLEKAKTHFSQVPEMLEAFEYWLGPYPFYEDSFKLVEVPYLGMEHQSSVTYGNGYQNGYLGSDLSGTGWGLKFDYIIIHEAGHEWFANSITYRDAADMWIQEGFTTYAESLFLDYHHGKEAAADYVIGLRSQIANDRPIIGPYGVNQSGSGDMYFKGANILHTLRFLVEDDEKWRTILRGLSRTFYHQTVSSAQVEAYLSEATGIDLTAFFNQYLRTATVPEFEYRIDGSTLHYRYIDVVAGFDMPVLLTILGKEHWIHPSADWKTKEFAGDFSEIDIDRNLYIVSRRAPQP